MSDERSGEFAGRERTTMTNATGEQTADTFGQIAPVVSEAKPELELSIWSSGSMRLIYWDWIEGKDLMIAIHPDGTVSRVETDANDVERLTPITMYEFGRSVFALVDQSIQSR